VSLPLPYGKKRSGVERDVPARGGPRPYAERLKDAERLVAKARPSQNSVIHALPEAGSILLIIGAFAPIVFAHPAIRGALFEPLAAATYPFSAGLAFAADAVWAGLAGTLIVCEAGVIGFLAWRLSLWNDARGATPASRRNTQLLYWLLVVVLAPVPVLVSGSEVGSSAAAAWVVVTGAAGVYGAWHARTRGDYHASVGGAVALMLGGRLFIGGAALACLALSDKEFPGQDVAKYNWRRSQVSIDPVRSAPAPQFEGTDTGAVNRARWQLGSAPMLAAFLLLFGGLAPFAYWPPLRPVLLGPFVEALMPLTTFVPIVSDAFWSLNPVYMLIIGLTSIVALAGVHFAMGARRPAAVAAAAVALIASGRVITGVAVLVVLLFSYAQYGEGTEPIHAHAGGEPAEPVAPSH
jgi:hypothetical protein